MARRRNITGKGRNRESQYGGDHFMEQDHSARIHRSFTKHARRRRQQRGISQSSIDTVVRFGRKQIRHDGYVYSMDRRSRRKAERLLGDEYRRVVDTLNIYVVISLDSREVITVAHRLGRLKQ